MPRKTPKPRIGYYYGMRIIHTIIGDTWLEGEDFCYSSPDGQAMNRRAYVKDESEQLRVVKCCIADTYFSIPAVARIAGKTVHGFITSDESGFKFIASAQESK